MRVRYAPLVAIVVFTGLTAVVGGQTAPDWTQWRGPSRDGTLASFVEPKPWPDTLTQRWKIPVGTGYATPIVVGNRVYSFARQGENEVMRAVDTASGKVTESNYAALSSRTRRRPSRPRTEIHSEFCERPLVHDGHERHRHSL